MAGRAHAQSSAKDEGVMFNSGEFCELAGIPSAALDAWTEAGWICPKQTPTGKLFSTIDVARARLILDLRGPMGINDEGVSVVLHLIDQIYSLRGVLLHVVSTTGSPEPFR